MKIKLTAFALALLMLLGTLCACGEKEGTTSGEESTPPPETAEPSDSDSNETEPSTEDPSTDPSSDDTTDVPPTEDSGEDTTEPPSSSDNPDTSKPPVSSDNPDTTEPPVTEPPKTEEDKYAEKPVDYTPIKAEKEDSSLRLWFDHAFAKTAQTDTQSSGRNTYKLYMGKNEIEDCQFYLASNSAKNGLKPEISNFKNSAGKTLDTSLYSFVYFDIDGKMLPDAIPPVNEANKSFNIAANTSQGFLIKVKTTKTTAAGDYEATLNIKNSAGEIVKTAKVFLKVWNFTLADTSACRTAMDLSEYAIYATMGSHYDNKWYAGDNSALYCKYYEYLLENRISAYNVPYGIQDSRSEKYLNDPRMTSFNITGWKANTAGLSSKVAAAYEKLSKNPEWLKKGYFYYVDEPATGAAVAEIRSYADILRENFPGYKMLSPFEVNHTMDNITGTDYISYMSNDITIWCPKPFCFLTYAEARKIQGGQICMTTAQEKKHGTFIERMKKEVQGGDELWWYVSCQPADPYITLSAEYNGVAYRELFWQQKLYDVTGFLYYLVNNWTGNGWQMSQTKTGLGQTVYGDGQLIYCGAEKVHGFDGPVGSIRLEAVRDGIEDYEYFYMIEKKIGTEKMKALIAKVTSDVVTFTDDSDFFAAQRVSLGNYLEDVLN